ncbi:MAG: hypothetical protein FWG85_05430 [Bacteroidetes bacterium]|nr:hypothetical protein [Bacteroidota bacterium]
MITIINFFLPIIALFVPKLKERRKHNINIKIKNCIWIHSASMGEFEQAKPLIELIKKNNNDTKILCTFFSPSGYNTQKKYPFADTISYLPIDTYWNAKKFINDIKPTKVVFIRYELWYNYLHILKKNNIKTFLINATYPNILKKNKILLPFYKKIFNCFTDIFAVSDFTFFNNLKLKNNIHKSADTRNDRIIEKVNEAKLNPIINRNLFSSDELIFVCGSVWNKDIDIIFSAINDYNKLSKIKIRLILVPHEPTNNHIEYIKNVFNDNILLSQILNNKAAFTKMQNKTIIVDSIGNLLKLYAIADLSYIGGGFGVGVHSITEPAGYAIPLITGPNCYNSPDTSSLINMNAMTSISDHNQLKEWLLKMNDANNRAKAGEYARKYIENNSGFTKIIYSHL